MVSRTGDTVFSDMVCWLPTLCPPKVMLRPEYRHSIRYRVRRADITLKGPDSVETTVLRSAAELILQTGQRKIDIQKLAQKADVPRTTVYTLFGAKGDDVRENILIAILNGFLAQSATMIEAAVATVDPRASTPIERLSAVFRATMASFKRDPVFGKVVLAQLNLQRKNEAALVDAIFKQVDRLIGEARKANQLASKPAKRLTDWKIRQVIFVVAHGLLRALYLREGAPTAERGSGTFSEKDVEIEVLRVLASFCSKDAAEKIQKTIEAIGD